MDASNISFRKWYIAVLFVSATKKGFSLLEIQHQMRHKRYQSVSEMFYKIRAEIGKRDDIYLSDDMWEFDEGN